jgi:hypothetical protein
MMRKSERKTKRGSLPALGRGVGHALLLAAVGLAVGLTSLVPPAVIAQDEMAAPSDEASINPLETTAPAQVPQASQATRSQQLPTDVQLRVGETATLDGGALELTLAQVAGDSRCPKDAMCVWIGTAAVTLHAVVDGVDHGDVKAELYPGPGSPKSTDPGVSVARYVLTLTDLQPYPSASQPQPLAERVASIHIASAAP